MLLCSRLLLHPSLYYLLTSAILFFFPLPTFPHTFYRPFYPAEHWTPSRYALFLFTHVGVTGHDALSLNTFSGGFAATSVVRAVLPAQAAATPTTPWPHTAYAHRTTPTHYLAAGTVAPNCPAPLVGVRCNTILRVQRTGLHSIASVLARHLRNFAALRACVRAGRTTPHRAAIHPYAYPPACAIAFSVLLSCRYHRAFLSLCLHQPHLLLLCAAVTRSAIPGCSSVAVCDVAGRLSSVLRLSLVADGRAPHYQASGRDRRTTTCSSARLPFHAARARCTHGLHTHHWRLPCLYARLFSTSACQALNSHHPAPTSSHSHAHIAHGVMVAAQA